MKKPSKLSRQQVLSEAEATRLHQRATRLYSRAAALINQATLLREQGDAILRDAGVPHYAPSGLWTPDAATKTAAPPTTCLARKVRRTPF